ncbi:MAG TPA: DnaJ domain-containing protein [Thermoanaerobaculia bacterium]|jgi:Tfp pilus assembly protein PilF|nr:DnaJ domain-containing protein [Thermoanaerobaculia bacterium]
MKVNYYEILGVERSASEQDIRDKFRKLARENHPDRYRGPDKSEAERKFQVLTEAVNVLTNPVRRRQHDAEIGAPAGKSPTDPSQIAKVYISKGAKAFKEGDIRAAYENFDMAVKHNPQDAKAQHYLGITAARIPSMMRQAVQAIEAAVQREPMNAQFLKDAGLICKKAGLNAKAERYLDEALKWDRENIEVQNALAELRQGKGETKDSGKGFGLFRKS